MFHTCKRSKTVMQNAVKNMKGKRIITNKDKNRWNSGKILYSKSVFNIISNISQRHHITICFLTFVHLFSLQHSSQAKLSNRNPFKLKAFFNIISNISRQLVHITMGFMCSRDQYSPQHSSEAKLSNKDQLEFKVVFQRYF